MGWVRIPGGVGPACVVGLALAASATSQANAADFALNSVIFGGIEVARSAYGSAGFKRGLTAPVSQTGFTLLASAGTGEDNKRDTFSPTGKRLTRTSEVQGLVGWQMIAPGGGFALHAGLRAQQRAELPSRPNAGEELVFGPALLVDAWLKPVDGWHAEMSISASTIRSTLWARAALAVEVPGLPVSVGPEIAAFTDEGSSDARIGLQMTGIAIGPARLRVSGGWVFREIDESGPYIALSGYAPL